MVINIHERTFSVAPGTLSPLIDGLASSGDQFWPRDRWPAMRFNGPLQIGRAGGHGPIRYVVEEYTPGFKIRFRFTDPRGFVGSHWFEIEELDGGRTRIRHVIEMRVEGSARITWPLLFRPLHDALLEDALDRAEAYITKGPNRYGRWSVWVRILRWILSPGRKKGLTRSLHGAAHDR